ncbi:unnamed protein product [Aspergillus oryzae]|nr:unnamed protein product [Aspergillus oryzae]GMF90744.1 unnamed protein product [Aspergillus oryzae]
MRSLPGSYPTIINEAHLPLPDNQAETPTTKPYIESNPSTNGYIPMAFPYQHEYLDFHPSIDSVVLATYAINSTLIDMTIEQPCILLPSSVASQLKDVFY